MVRVPLAIVLCMALAPWPAPAPEAAQSPVLDLARLLDDYWAGRFDEAVGAVEAAGDAQANILRTQWRTVGRQWIETDPSTKPHRLLVAASFALETERLRVERGGWSFFMAGVCPAPPKDPDAKGPAGQCVIEWAWSLLVERNQPDAAERTWLLGASALVAGVRDWRLLYRATPGAKPEARGLLAEALVRHPDDSRLKLEQAMALSARYNVTNEGGGTSPVAATVINIVGRGTIAPPRPRPDSPDNTAALFLTLVDDPEVGAEARLRLGYLLWAIGETERGRSELAAAARAATDDDLKYLAHFLHGWTALPAQKANQAAEDFNAALKVRPNSQSATLALAALELQRGEAGRAHDLTRDSFAARPDDADPWRTFLYGHYATLPGLLAALRKQLPQ